MKIKNFRIRRGPTVAACVLAVAMALGGCAARPPLQSVIPAQPAKSPGGKIYAQWCSDCHSTAAGPGSRALQRKYQGAVPAILEQRGNLPADYVKLVVRRGISFMPSFRKTEISDADLALVAAYLTPAQ